MPYESILDKIGLRHGTDKSSSYHDYLSFYEMFFADLRNKSITLLEIGVHQGASLRTWNEYFSAAKIVGADLTPAAKRFEGGRIAIELLDQSNMEELTRAAIKHGPFDIIIEDGSHRWDHQVTSLRTLFPFVKHDGIYIVEDLQTNFGPAGEEYRGVATRTCVDFLKSWLDLHVEDDRHSIEKVEDPFLRTYGRAVEFMTFYRHACLIKKKFSPQSREIAPGSPLDEGNTGQSVGAARIVAHIGNVGDVFGPSGFVNVGAGDRTLQGFAIECQERLLEYRVRSADGTWSKWAANNSFVGTRGKAQILTGFTIRLTASAKHRFSLRAFGRFQDSLTPVYAGDGEDCASPSGKGLCGIQVDLMDIRSPRPVTA